MNKPEMNSTSKTMVVEYTEADIEELRKEGYSEDELPKIGKHIFRRARHITPRREQKIKVTMYLDADILDFFKERAKEPNASPYQTQINNELRAVMEGKPSKDEVVTISMLDNPAFIAALAEKLKAA
jgi:uncharacterized protein (DUF4415 family)